ncbi:MAG: M23 family metallopeptidase [Anaerolineales bacterium]|nr:M23 family metallopeptidase [Anaerolineales bacterium]
MFRAPIRGNPAERKIAVVDAVTIDAYAIDPLNHRLWFRRTEGIANAPAGAVLRWFQIIEPTMGFILQEQGIIVPKQDFDGVESLSMERSDIEQCLFNVPNISTEYSLPPLDNVPWERELPLVFTHYPVSMYQTCVAQTFHQVYGFAHDTKFYGYYAPGYHFGVDFFAPPGSVVYAGANHGFVVALIHRNEFTGAKWGNYGVTPTPKYHDPDLTPFAVVIRYGHLFVVYGHFDAIAPDIWVGKEVNEGSQLGTLGTFSDSHLHMTLMSFGGSSPDAYVTWAQEIDPQNPQAPKSNRWGIPDFRRTADDSKSIDYPQHMYDFTQFFEPDPILLSTLQAVLTGTPNTLEQPIHKGVIWAEDRVHISNLLRVEGLGGKHQSLIALGFPCQITYSQSFPESVGWRYVEPLVTPTILPRHRSFIYYPGIKASWTPAPAADPRVAIPAPNLPPIPTLTPTRSTQAP